MLRPKLNLQQHVMPHVIPSVLAVCAVGLFLACAKAPEIELRGPEKPKDSVADTTTPSSNEETEPGTGDTGPGGPVPGATPTPAPVPVTRYRALCDDRYPSYLTAISSMASSAGFGSDLDLQVWPEGVALPVRGGFASEDRNLEYHMFPQTIEIRKGSILRLAFSAKPLASGTPWGTAQRNVYVSDAAMIDRIGRAQLVGPEMPAEAAAVSFAGTQGFQAKTFNVSDDGKYLLVQDQKGVLFFDAMTLQGLGRVELKSATDYFLPLYRTADRLLMISKMKSGRVLTETLKVEFKRSGEVLEARPVFSVSDLRRPLAFVGRDLDDPIAGMRVGAGGDSEIALVNLSRGPKVTSFQIKALPVKGKVASSLAVWKDAGTSDLRAAIGFESVSQTGSGFTTRYKVDQAFVRVLKLDVGIGVATAVGSDYDYPSEALRTIEAGSASARMTGIKDLVVSPDGNAVFGLFPGSLSYQVYRFTSSGFDRMSQEDCTNLSIGVEP
ncbi:MAG: hypothetical protein U1E10_09335 [Bdellovibrionales bacterium]|nr:hypothetical protein [Bdellovibrionales bacterium]